MNLPEANRPLRILHIILTLRPTNGQYNEHCLPLMHERDITICTFFKAEIKPPDEIRLFDGDNTIPGFHRALKAALEAGEYDVIHAHTPHAGTLLLLTLLLTGKFRELRARTVHTVQNSFQNFSLRNQLMFYPSFAYSQQVIFCSHASYESFPDHLKKLCTGRMQVIQNAFDPERIDQHLNGDQRTERQHFKAVTVGLIRMKNPFTVLRAFQEACAEGSELVYLGEGDLRPPLTEEIKRSGLEAAVTLKGMVPRDSVFDYFHEADLFISASWGEGLPVAVLEAMACRRPVLLSDIPPHREITEGIDFIPLVKPDDVAGFAKEIERFQNMSPSEREAIGNQCRRIVEERFSLSVMHTEYARVYTDLTGKRFPELMAKLK